MHEEKTRVARILSGYLGSLKRISVRLHPLPPPPPGNIYTYFFPLPTTPPSSLLFLYLTLRRAPQRDGRNRAGYVRFATSNRRVPFEDEKLASHNNLIFIVIASVERGERARGERGERSLRKSPEVPFVIRQRERAKGARGGKGWRA